MNNTPKDIERIVEKHALGKRITEKEKLRLREWKRSMDSSTPKLREKRTEAEMAEEYNVSRSTIVRWKREGAPFEDDEKLNIFVASKERPPAGFKKWREAKGFASAVEADDIGKDFESKEKLRDYYFEKLSAAAKQNSVTSVKLWNELLLKTDESIRRSEAHAAKLGIDNGTVMPRAEVERVLRAVFYAGNACIQGALTAECERLVAYDKPEDLYHALKPLIVGSRLFAGFDKVANIAGAPGIPEWFIECVRQEAEQYLSSSEALWTKADQ